MNFIEDFQCRTTYGVDSTDELHPIFPVQDHIRGVGEGVFHVDRFYTVFSYRVFLYRDSCGSFSEAEFSLELRIRLRVRVLVQRQRAASAEEKKKKSIIKIAKASLLMYL